MILSRQFYSFLYGKKIFYFLSAGGGHAFAVQIQEQVFGQDVWIDIEIAVLFPVADFLGCNVRIYPCRQFP